MVKRTTIVLGAVPAIFALLIAVPLITQPEIPITAVDPNDKIEIEYTKYQIKKISFGLTEQVAAQKTEILLISSDGSIRYTVTEDGVPQPDKLSNLEAAQLKKITAMIKETGFITIPTESFPVRDNVGEYQKSSLKVILNGQVKRINWLEQNATEKFVPPLITIVELELDHIIDQLIE